MILYIANAPGNQLIDTKPQRLRVRLVNLGYDPDSLRIFALRPSCRSRGLPACVRLFYFTFGMTASR